MRDRQRIKSKAATKTAVRYGEGGIEAARRLVQRVAGTDAAAAFALVARLYLIEPEQTTFNLAAFDACGWPNTNLKDRLQGASDAFLRAFTMPLVTGGPAGSELAPDLVALLDRNPFASSVPTALLDSEGTTWVMIAVAAARATSGHHLALRCRVDDRRSVADFAAHVAAAGSKVICFGGDEPLQAAILAAELFGDDDTLIVADGCTSSMRRERTTTTRPIRDKTTLSIPSIQL